MSDFQIRFGTPPDLPALLDYEKTYFPAVPGTHHAGYLYSDAKLATLTLTEEIAAPARSFTIVAEKDSKLIGFAAAAPWSLPTMGERQLDPMSMVLQYIAVAPDHRRQGVASALLAEIEQRAIAARQNVIVAHVPADASFYAANGWHVSPTDHGFAWLPFGNHLRADVGDPDLGFPLIAGKTLRPRAIRRMFDFEYSSGRPTADAAMALTQLIDAGEIDMDDLDEDTKGMVGIARLGPAPEGAYDMLAKLLGGHGPR